MKRIQSRIKYYSQKLVKLEALLKGKTTKKYAIDIIFAIAKTEAILESLKVAQAKSMIVPFKRAIGKVKIQSPGKGRRAWLARLSSERDKKYGGFVKEFLEPTSREFDRKGETLARFEIPINLKDVFQDSEGDFWMFENYEGNIKVISYQEAHYILENNVCV